MYSSKENINILTTLMVAYGIRHVVVCPGSRNAPLVHNFNECPDIVCHPVTDERSAAFVALGLRLQTCGLVAVCVTSGSALLNLLPGVAEASYQKKGIIVISADRPQAWIGQLDGQTMPQKGALGKFVSSSVSLPECHNDDERWMCRRLICEAVVSLQSTDSSVHINVPVSEPLFEFNVKKLPDVDAVFLVNRGESIYDEILFTGIQMAERPMIIVGQQSHYNMVDNCLNEISKHIVVLSEPLGSNKPSPSLDVLFSLMGDKVADYQPDLILYVGGNTISKRLRQFMRSIPKCTTMLISRYAQLQDPTQHARFLVVGDIDYIMSDIMNLSHSIKRSAFYHSWNKLIVQTRSHIEAQPMTIEEQAVKELEKHLKPYTCVFYANSLSVRLAARYSNRRVFCNRGLNGIDGSLSTAVGASLVTSDKVFCVIGDLSFFYDQNALWNSKLSGNLRILLLNNGGGRIFERLPGLEASAARDSLVMAKHSITAEGACMEYDITHIAVKAPDELGGAIKRLATEQSERPILVEVIK